MKEGERQFAFINGIGLGEETKGNTVQAMVRELDAHTVWRSGGWQGGHHITHDDGREIVLSFWGAGVIEGADTYLKHMVIAPVELFQEGVELEQLGVPKPFDRMFVDENCIATTPFHSGISRTREVLRGENKKGTIGKGVGEALKDALDPELTIRAGEFRDRATILRKAENIRQAKIKAAEVLLRSYPGIPPEEVYAEMEVLSDKDLVTFFADACGYTADLMRIVGNDHLDSLLKRDGAIVNEVSHGVLHHPRYGFVPHVTQIDPTAQDVLATVRGRNYDGNLMRLGVVRSYLTRHGAGPFVSYDKDLTNELVDFETHNNVANEWLGDFKTGHFDIVALQYALAISGGRQTFDGLFISYMDILAKRKEWGVVEAYEYKGKASDLNEYFHLDNGTIVEIKVHPDHNEPGHYAHQLRLTELLNECAPLVSIVQSTPDQNLEQVFLQYVTDKLGVPVVGTAYGPKVADRYFRPEWQNVLHKGK